MWRGCVALTVCLFAQPGAQGVVETPTLEAAVAQSHHAADSDFERRSERV